ncbi:MAG: hypothetical protein A3H42_00720, partial [Deltaproteobacteria bacterium RIFCSPLOWO2_02_FULL_46_8]
MQKSKIAAIDIGTHSVLLLIVEKKQTGEIKVLADEATLTRIGEGMGSTNLFLPAAMERTLNVLKKYKKICDDHEVETILTVGTAAFRKAQNADLFIEQVSKECGILIEIISGKKEAAFTWKAASTDFGPDIVVVDIGGGSTEIITAGQRTMDHGPETKNINAVSLPIGSVLLTEKYCHSDPISDEDYKNLCEAITKKIEIPDRNTRAHEHTNTLVAIAGTATTLAAIKMKMKVYKHQEVHGSKISLGELKKIIAELKSKTVEERKKIPGLEPGRADVILAG